MLGGEKSAAKEGQKKRGVERRHARPRGRSHYTVAVHTAHTTSALTRSPHTEGSASSRSPHGATRGQEGDARVGPPPTPQPHGVPTRHGSRAGSCPPHQYIHPVQSSHGIPAGSPPPVHPPSTIIARHPCRKSSPRTSSQQPLRLRAGGWATNERLLRPHHRNRGALTAPAPRAALPTRSRSTHGAPIQKRQVSGANAARDETSHACRSLRSAPNPELPERGRSGGLTPPPQAPRSGAETSAERRRTRPTLIS